MVGAAFETTISVPSTLTLADARDQIRDHLDAKDDGLGKRGQVGTDLFQLAITKFGIDEDMLSMYYRCRACDYESEEEGDNKIHWMCLEHIWKDNPSKLGTHKGKDISQWINACLIQKSNKPCPSCQTLMCKASRYDQVPPFLLFICHDIKVKVQNEFTFPGINQRYRLCGIIYFANYHFVCRVIDKSGGVWYHNGNENNNKSLYIGNIVNYDSKSCRPQGLMR